MRVFRSLCLLVCCSLGGSGVLAAQDASRSGLARRSGVLAAGLRDGGDFGNALFVLMAGIRFRTAPNVALGANISHTAVREESCPGDPSQRCFEGGGSITAVELEVEFQYLLGGLQPYGVASLGVSHMRTNEDRADRLGAAYSTGLGLRAHLSPRAWLLGEGRWRQDMFGRDNARGPLIWAGIGWAF